jgi:hypothetical protein
VLCVDAAIDKAHAGVSGVRLCCRVGAGHGAHRFRAAIEIHVVVVVGASGIELAQAFQAAARAHPFRRLEDGDLHLQIAEFLRSPYPEQRLERERQSIVRDVDGHDFGAHHEIAARIAIELGAIFAQQPFRAQGPSSAEFAQAAANGARRVG